MTKTKLAAAAAAVAMVAAALERVRPELANKEVAQ